MTFKALLLVIGPEGSVFVVGEKKTEVERLMTKLRSLDIKTEYTGHKKRPRPNSARMIILANTRPRLLAAST